MGMDTEGVTALLNTISNLDSSDLPGDFPLDVMLLPKTIEGEAGLVLLKTILKVYFNNDGCAIHFNIFDSKMYRDAQKHPENYENLQVRVCGWNVRWNDIPLVEQEKYLARAEGISQ
jgi:pyruvate-formate lyase